jgi:heme exporter protein C
MTRTRRTWATVYALLACLGLALAMVRIFLFTPTELTMGPMQKVFYLHLPSAINTFVACLVVFIASVGYLWQRRLFWDNLATAAAGVAVLLCSVVLITGMAWAKSAWGQWWVWSPRLTFSLMLWLLYVVYLVIRPSIESRQRRALICSVYGIIAFLDVPLVYLSVRLMLDVHPVNVELHPAMQLTLWLSFIPVTMICLGLIALSYAARGTEQDPSYHSAASELSDLEGGVA